MHTHETCPGWTPWGGPLKSEARNPKTERNPMPETRTGSPRRFWPPAEHAAAASAQQTVRGANAAFGPSDFGILSDLGLRPSDFAHFPTVSSQKDVGHAQQRGFGPRKAATPLG